ncbi:putative NBD/HSP70 family sugar kinase [Streptomyces sp. 1114.5]|uniref:ROK family transcriptional regulator n=1 Tax=unclassified Streptomyces TaxID=2593676 RepID=UPI000BDC2F8B|nr:MULTISPECIES: ROK family transcriptional regulator [unclassified Streptomyces]RKT15936.1 putative NBD/HSP70 family sugar kinase [Streptomyces sp. 1114.5]SOB82110.1 Sugar kinase of the NBD/HSP70 family, may contain an N-terminal HTH domain [Streptomyces sp. 1331.2]
MREPDAVRTGPASQQGMRRANLALVLGVIASGPRSRAEVAAETGLTRAAVSSLAEQLIAGGLLVEEGPAAPSGKVGRPGTALGLNPLGPGGLGAEIGVRHLGACVVDLRGEVRAWRREESANHGREPAAVMADLARLLRSAVAEAGLRPAGLALAVPGLVGSSGAVLQRAANLGWRDVPLAAEMRAALRPAADGLAELPVEADNEANLGGLAERWLGDGAEDFLYVSAEAGVGAAIVVGGRLLRGARGYAGEFGHVPVHPDGPRCACGAHGCLEQYAGEAAVLRAAGLTGARGDWVALLADRAAAGDEPARAALAGAGTALGIAASGAVNLLDPAEVVLGGGFARLAPWLLPAMRAELAARVTVRPWADDRLTVSRLGRRGPLLGAAVGVVRAVVADPGSIAGG